MKTLIVMFACLLAACGALPHPPAQPDQCATASSGGAKIGDGKKMDATAHQESGGTSTVKNGDGGTRKHDVAVYADNGGSGSSLSNGSGSKKQDCAAVADAGGAGSGSSGVKKHDLKGHAVNLKLS